MKKPILITLWFLSLFALNLKVKAADLSDLNYVNNGIYVTIVKCDRSAVGSLSIPIKIEGIAVGAIGNDAFKDCWRLTDITIPNTVTSIGNKAFFGCSNLTSFIIPDSVTSIGTEAFVLCSKLEDITIGRGLTIISDAAFAYCEGIKRITIPSNIQKINNYAFADSTNIERIYFEGNAPIIGSAVFRNVVAAIYINSRASGFDSTFGGLIVAIQAQPALDTDNDGVPDKNDAFPNDPNETMDSDNDGIGDNADSRSGEVIAALQAQIDALSSRPTLDQITDARGSSLVINSENGTVTITFNVEESEDLKTWKATGDKITKTIQLKEGKKFYRFALDK